MLTNLQEIQQVMTIIEEIQLELEKKEIGFDKDIQIGGMVEVPASAVCADIFAKKLDFLSIGTNDLIQYTMAIDCVNDEVNYLYDPFHPSVLRLIHMTINAGKKAKIPVAMCGEMAGDPNSTRLLLGLGLREFSVHSASLLEIKKIIIDSDVEEATRLAKRALKANNGVDVIELFRNSSD